MCPNGCRTAKVRSGQSLDRVGSPGGGGGVGGGTMKDVSGEILFQSFLPEAIASSSGMGRDVHFLMSVQHILCRPRRRSPFKVYPEE